jgi:hypothetical protein
MAFLRNSAGLWCLLVAVLVGTGSATKYADDFEELGVSARSVAMGSALVAAGADPAAMYYNPSASVLLSKPDVMLMHAENFGGLVKNDFASVMLPSGNSCLGFGLLHNGVSGIKLTKLLNDSLPLGAEFVDTTFSNGDTSIDTVINRPVVSKVVSAADWVFYFNYARELSSHFLVGGNAKLIYRTTGVSTCFGMGLDAGATAILVKGFNIGLRVRNLSTSPLFWDTRTRELMMPLVALGIGKTFNLGRKDRLLVDVEGEGNFEGLPITENIGMEYQFHDVLFGRLGFQNGNFTMGLGGQYKQFFLDYAFQTAAYPDAQDLPSSQKIDGGIRF